MINYLVYIIILLILVFVSITALKAISRGIEAKKNLNKDDAADKNDKNINEKD